MKLLILSVLWLVMGVLIGGLANAAKLRPRTWGRGGWLWMLGIGALVALLGGWLGTWLLGTLFATATALWVAVVGVVVVPRVMMWCNTRLHTRSITP